MQHAPLKSRVQTQKRRESWFYFIMQNGAQNMSSHGSRNGWSYSLTTCASIASFSSHVFTTWLKSLAEVTRRQLVPLLASFSNTWLKSLAEVTRSQLMSPPACFSSFVVTPCLFCVEHHEPCLLLSRKRKAKEQLKTGSTFSGELWE